MAVIAVFNSARNQPIAASKYVADVTRTWVWNDVGSASFLMPRSHPGIAELLKFGNIVRIIETGLPTWVGTIEEKSWSAGGVTVELRSLEQQLAGYITDQGLVFGASTDGATSTSIVAGVARNAWGNGWTALRLGSLQGSTKHFKEYDYAVLLAILQELAEGDKAAFWVDDTLALNYAPERGTLRETLLLREGSDLVNVTVTESRSEVLTNILALGAGSDLIDQPKLLLQYPDLDYYVAEVIDFSDAIDQNGLRDPATEVLKTRVIPKTRVEAEIVNRNGNWENLRIGDRIYIGVYTDDYRVIAAKITGQEITTGQAMRCVFEFAPTLPAQAPSAWAIS